MREKVIIVGAGVGGLTAAHELIERGFDVHVYERRSFAGGKAASVRVPTPAQQQAPATSAKPSASDTRPGEHGFRFFPSWYRHLPDTLRKVPFRGLRTYYEGATVYDNLVAADVNLLTWYDRDPTPLPMHLPRSAGQLRALADFGKGLKEFGLGPTEGSFFLGKLALFLATPEDKRVEQFQGITWWDYVEADSKSAAYKSLVSATTRTMVAAKATEACAYTIGKLALRTLFDSVSDVDRVLNGPTNEVWINPWIEHLTNRGVRFHFGRELESISFNEREPRITSLNFSQRLAGDLARLRAMLEPWASDLAAIAAGTPDTVADQGPARAGAAAMGSQVRLSGAAFRARQARVNATEATSQQLLDNLLDTLAELEDEPAADAARKEVLRLKAALGARPAPEPAVPAAAETEPEKAARAGETKRKLEAVGDQLRKQSKKLRDAWVRFDSTPAFDSELANLARGFGELVAEERSLSRSSAVDADRKVAPLLAAWLHEIDIIVSGVQTRGSAIRQLEVLHPAEEATAKYFVFSLPVEQMAYYVNRSATARLHDPGLERIVRLADATEWMAGVQFYLQEPINLTPGHIIGMDSEWGLTAIEQTQFWRDIAIPSEVKSILSVDVAAWDRRGREIRKEAYNCTDLEIATEVWAQLKAALNRTTRQPLLDDRMLVGGKPIKGLSFHVDDSIVDVFDRKKQGAYERARSVRFSVTDPSRAEEPQDHVAALTTPYVWGPRLRYNAEPLLVNRIGTHALRPDAKTNITNLFLASDYVKTETDLACMEGANEAARRATNALLDAAGSSAKRCETWDFMSASNWAESLLAVVNLTQGNSPANVALKGASAVADSALGMAGQAAGMLKKFWEKK